MLQVLSATLTQKAQCQAEMASGEASVKMFVVSFIHLIMK